MSTRTRPWNTAVLLIALLTTYVPLDAKKQKGEDEITNSHLSDELDLAKFSIEAPLESLVNSTAEPATNIPDASKLFIESPLENVVKDLKAPPSTQYPKETANDTDNPACQPGLVHWHSDFEKAKSQSRQSGKPVLLFQLLGQLDQTFT